MDIVAKLYDGNNIKAQWINPPSLFWEEELVGTNELVFELALTDSQLYLIKEVDKIKFFDIADEENHLWSGWINRIELDFQKATLYCADEKKLMERKIIYENKNFSNKTIAEILTILCNEWNARSGESLTFETDITDTFTKDFYKGTTYFSILSELADLSNAEWTTRNNKIIFKENIGEDKSSGVNFIEFASSIYSPNENTISGFKKIRSAANIYNAVIGKNTDQYSEKEVTNDFPRLEVLKIFSDGDLDKQTQNFLDESSVSQDEISFDVSSSQINFKDVGIGDIVAIRIEHGNPLIDMDTTVKVIYKKVDLTKGVPNFSVKLAKKTMATKDSQNYFLGLERQLKNLQIK